ncbi:NACHT domain-containing protein [Streptomyces sp. NPDC059866]|uniref:NACHT domain-containing protein n=1 Tax=Streptomyces sp. NPDC059866 TaxID=3346978 RepID=UPI00365DA9CF
MGKAYLLLSVLGAIAALVVAHRFDLDTAETAVSVLLGLAPAYLAWAAFRADRLEASPVDLGKVVGELAVAVKNQWDSEAEVRRVNDPYPLPVAWRAADDDLAESWPLLGSLARAWPGGPPGDSALWPSDAAGLAGQDAEIGQVFSERVPTRRLVILGEPGAGKSVLLIRLLQDLVARRSDSDPVPVLFSLASWDPHQSLKTWMADQLRRTYPGLAAEAPSSVALTHTAGSRSKDLATSLLNAGLILPLLDGLDELPPSRHAVVLDTLNRTLPARQPLVMTSRTGPYRTALTRAGTTVRLNGAATIQLLPLDAQSAASYLRRDAGGPYTPAVDRWDTVITHLGTTSPVGQALATPLALFLARTIYNPRPGAFPGARSAPRPDELCDTTAYPDHAAINAHLFQVFIPAAYTPHQPNPPRWTADQAHETFAFLARLQQNQRAGSPDLAWWELSKAIPRHIRLRAFVLLAAGIIGLMSGLIIGLFAGRTEGLEIGLVAGLAAGSACGLVAGLTGGLLAGPGGPATPHAGLRLSFSGSLPGLVSGLVFGLVGGLTTGLAAGLAGGVAVGLLTGPTFGLEANRADLASSPSPHTLLISDRRSHLAHAFMIGIMFGGVLGVVLGFTDGPMPGLMIGLSVGLCALAVGATTRLGKTAWGNFIIARACLAVRHNTPWHLMAFLQDAHEHRGVLRRVGAVYQFRHIDLQRHLATSPISSGLL